MRKDTLQQTLNLAYPLAILLGLLASWTLAPPPPPRAFGPNSAPAAAVLVVPDRMN